VERLKAEGASIAIVDALSNDDLYRVGAALKGVPLITGRSGLAIGLPQNYGVLPSPGAGSLPHAAGFRAVVSGSCSLATNRQEAHFRNAGGQGRAIDPSRLAAGADVVSEPLDWAKAALPNGTVLIYSTADMHAVKALQQ
jgi:3-dehydrotetronate 4-kinase